MLCTLDPLGRSAPDLPAEAKIINKVSKFKDAVTMICNAQASPPPDYR